jgi:hypothetical protein
MLSALSHQLSVELLTSVMLSAAIAEQSEAITESKDPYLNHVGSRSHCTIRLARFAES